MHLFSTPVNSLITVRFTPKASEKEMSSFRYQGFLQCFIGWITLLETKTISTNIIMLIQVNE